MLDECNLSYRGTSADKNGIYQNEIIQYFLENTGGSSQKETGKKEKRWQERVVPVMGKVT